MKIFGLNFRRKSISASTGDMARFTGGNQSATGKTVTDSNVMGISAAWSCMRVLSETIGAIPWSMYKSDGRGNAEKDETHPLAFVLHSPNQDMTSTEFREALILNLCQRGNAYCLTERRPNGDVLSLYPIPSATVTPKRKQGTNTRLPISEGEPFYVVNDRGRPEDMPREKIWHVKGFGGDGLVGLSPLGAARETMGMALATEEFGAKFFSQGGMPSGTVSIPNWLDEEQRKKARENLNQMLTGLGNAHRFALFEGGMKPEPWGAMPLEDMQFLSLRQFSVAEICRFYRVPPHMVADLSKATFSNIEQQSQEFVTYTLMPYFTRLESSAAKWLMKPEERSQYFVRFNFEGLLRADSAARSAFYNSALQNGWMNRNEVRAKENLNRVQGLDEYTVQSNMTLVDQLAAMLAGSTANNAREAEERSEEREEEERSEAREAEKRSEAREAKSFERIAQIISNQPVPMVNVTLPEIKMPEINISPAQINVHPPNVIIEKSGAMRAVVESRDDDGFPISTRLEETH